MNCCAVWPRMTFPSWVRIFTAKVCGRVSGSSVSSRKANVVRSGSKKSWMFAAAALCGFFGVLLPTADARPQSAPSSAQSQADPAPSEPPAQATPNRKKSGTSSNAPNKTGSARKQTGAVKHRPVNARKPRTLSPRVRRMRQAFVASASLRHMAQQLLQDRSLAAYTGVDAFARAHAKDDAGALAWLVLGYAHVLDRDFARAIDPLNRAKVHAGSLGDYVAYYLGNSYLQTGRTAEALATLANFGKTYPDSLLVRDAQVHYADALLLEGQPAEAVTLLEQICTPVRSDVEFALGRAYAASGQHSKAAETLANVYYTIPTSVEADAAYAELKKLPSVPQPTVTQLKTRADALMGKHRYADAADEYRSLANQANSTERPSMQIALADALRRSGKNRDAKQVLALLGGEGGEINAHRLYLLGQVAFATNDNPTFYRTVDELRQAGPASPWLEQALLSAANLHLVHHEYDQALDAFREAQQRFPTGARASYVHWKAAWLTLRQGRNEDAKKAFEEQIALYPSGGETPAALYWRARLAEEDNQPGMARAFYQKLSDRYRNFYYAELARQRMKHLPAIPAGETAQHPLLDRVPPLDSSGKIADSEPPSDELHV